MSLFKPVLLVKALFLLFALSACEAEKSIRFPKTDMSEAALIPHPLKIVPSYDGFGLDQYTAIQIPGGSEDFKAVGAFLAEKIQSKTGLEVAINPAGDIQRVIVIDQKDLESSNKEAYKLQITRDTILLESNHAEGAFRGVQTLRQLIPDVANDTLAEHSIWVVPTGEIQDEPQFTYRGTMLDVSRHFFDADYIKSYIEILAYYKINFLHLHLSDDQGWRIEIKSWPRLTEVGGRSQVGGGPGGYYTQEQFKEIVAHAAAHYITIVPEIDMPGHTNAASVSYPILNGNGKPLKPYTGTRVGFSTFDTRKDTVYAFIDDVVKEIATLSPGPYFHIGGDESHVTQKEDYLYFVNRVNGIVTKHGKQLIGWDEVANADLSSTSVAQFWRHENNANTAIGKGMQIILSPADRMYLDMKYNADTDIGLDWAGHIAVDKAYNWNPEELFPVESILGIEAPLWSETLTDTDKLEYLAFPRLIGYAELGWTVQPNRDWEDYKVRLSGQTSFLQQMNIHFFRSPLIDWE